MSPGSTWGNGPTESSPIGEQLPPGMQELTRLKANATSSDDLAWLLVVDSMVFQAEAEVRWLDHCEARLVRAAEAGPRQARIPSPSPGTDTPARQEATR